MNSYKYTNLPRKSLTVRVIRTAHRRKFAISFMMQFLAKLYYCRAAITVYDILPGAVLQNAVLTVYSQLTDLLAQGYVVYYVFRRFVIYWTDFISTFPYTRFTECVLKI